MSNLPVVAIVGAPNVGKSTFLNRVLGRRQAVVSETAGTTRDRSYNRAEWAGREFLLVDTGGMEPTARGGLAASVTLQAK
nr:50S ribosome-binding GTPase [Actinomycetota bacterium]